DIDYHSRVYGCCDFTPACCPLPCLLNSQRRRLETLGSPTPPRRALTLPSASSLCPLRIRHTAARRLTELGLPPCGRAAGDRPQACGGSVGARRRRPSKLSIHRGERPRQSGDYL